MVRIGKLTLDAPFFQAGLAGYSDAAMRRIARRHGSPYCVTEAMLDQFLISGGKALAAAKLQDTDHPIAGQLMGSDPYNMAAAAKILLELGYDVIDINLACPVKKIRKKHRGGHLMSVPEEAIAILDSVIQAVGEAVPCTVKLRRGSDDTVEAEQNFHTIFEAAIELGYAGAVVHGRTVEQKYLGPSRWVFLKQLVDRYANQPLRHLPPQASSLKSQAFFTLGGSGDIWTAGDIFNMIEQTGVSWVSVARGCIGNPWLFTQARAYMGGDLEAAVRPPTIDQQRQVLLDHFELSVALHGEVRASKMMRKFGIKFCVHHPQADAVKAAFIAVGSIADWRTVIEDHYSPIDCFGGPKKDPALYM